MPKIAFNKGNLDKLEPKAARYYVHHDKIPGLTLAVHPSGDKSFYLYRRVNGRPQRIRIGGFPDLTPDQARDAAERLNGEIADGGDPSERRRMRKRLTLGQVFDHYKATHLEPHSTASSLAEDTRRFEKHFESWRTRSLDQIKPDDVAALHAKLGKDAPVEANRVLTLLRRTMNHGIRHLGWHGENPTRVIKRFPEQTRDRFLDGGEIQRLFAALKAEPDHDIRDYALLLLLSGARRRNVLGMKWADLDLERGLWRIPAAASKNKQPMNVILPPQAVAILRARQNGREEVFRRADGRLPGIVKGWDRIRETAKLSDVRMHDLRRTLGSWAASTGASLPIIGKALGHRDVKSTAIYSRLDLDPVRRAVHVATSAMLAAGGDAVAKLLPAPAAPAETNGKAKKVRKGRKSEGNGHA